jgi:hypothetical protein
MGTGPEPIAVIAAAAEAGNRDAINLSAPLYREEQSLHTLSTSKDVFQVFWKGIIHVQFGIDSEGGLQ